MILFDTNVVSALMKPEQNDAVVKWMNRARLGVFYLSSPTIHEVLYGLAISPPGKRRADLTVAFETRLLTLFHDRVFPFDRLAAEHSARLAANRKQSGMSIDILDTQIAGIALAQGATLATRNIRHFEDAGIDLIDPWNAS